MNWIRKPAVLASFIGTALLYPLICFAPIIQVEIMIEPGGSPNAINLNGNGLIPVAILSSQTFDATSIDVTTLAFGPYGAAPAHNAGGHYKDVDLDGLTDVVSHYRTQDTGIECDDIDACVTGELFDGTPFEGCDAVAITPNSSCL